VWLFGFLLTLKALKALKLVNKKFLLLIFIKRVTKNKKIKSAFLMLFIELADVFPTCFQGIGAQGQG
jgi:hypothetical protein